MVTPPVKLPVEFSCKVLPYGLPASLGIVVTLSMTLMYIGIFINIPSWILVILMVATMYYFFSQLICMATFTLSSTGLSRTLHPSGNIFRQTTIENYSWNQLKGYKNGSDLGRFRGEYQYLEIKFKDGKEWKLTDTYGTLKSEYAVFLQSFLYKVEEYNARLQTSIIPDERGSKENTNEPLIIRKKTIYESIWGKIFTVLLGLFILNVLLYGLTYMSSGAKFKLVAVLIPGFCYMAYRVFIKKK